MAIKFSQFNLRTDHTSGMHLVGYDGNQNIHITVDNLFDGFVNGTENTIAMFGTDGTVLADSILSQDAGAALLTVAGQLNVDAAATFDTSITVTGDSALNGNVALGDESGDLITQTGTLYLNGPVKDTTNTLGDTDKILVSDAAGELTFQKLSETHVKSSELIVQSIKANEALTKGDPVYIVGFQVGQGVNIVAKADASNPAKMPATGIIDEDYSAQAFGTMTAFGSFNTNFDASGGSENWSIGDILFVKSGGGLTNIKPTGSDLIQNVAIVSRNHQQTGELEVVALGRTNDIPNLTPGRLWAGSTGNTIESQTLFVDEANTRLGVGTTNPSAKLEVAGTDGNFQTTGHQIFLTKNGVNQIYTDSGASPDASQLAFGTNNTERMRINSTGNVGIATTNPLHNLQIGDGSGSKSLAVSSGTESSLYLSTPNSTAQSVIGFGNNQFATINTRGRILYQSSTTAASNYMQFNVAFNEIMRLTNSNVGIGTTNPDTKLHVEGNLLVDAYNIGEDNGIFLREGFLTIDQPSITVWDMSNSGASPDGLSINAYDGIRFRENGGEVARFKDGDVGIGTTSPESKLDVNGGIRMADDSSTASASNVGTLRYRTSGNNSYVDMCMQTGASTYAWVNIVQNNW